MDLLILVDGILASLCVTKALEKFLTDQALQADLLRATVVQLHGEDKVIGQLADVLTL